jgi:hypothetical protein
LQRLDPVLELQNQAAKLLDLLRKLVDTLF